jgi:hypothetical protein
MLPRADILIVAMSTSGTGLLKGKTIELEDPIPELEGKRVRVVLEPLEEPRLSAAEQRELWDQWVELGPQGPIDDAGDTQFP